jgi:hypothetical protein
VYNWTVICEGDPVFFYCACVGMAVICCVLSISLFFRLWIICNGNPLFLGMVSIMFHSCCFACSVIGSVIILFMWKVYAARLCSDGYLDLKCIVVPVYMAFLWIPKYRLLLCLWLEISKQFILLCSSSVSWNSTYLCILFMWLVFEYSLFLFWSNMIRMLSTFPFILWYFSTFHLMSDC